MPIPHFESPEQEEEYMANEAAIDRDVKETVARRTAERQAVALERIAGALEAMNSRENTRAVVEAPAVDVDALRETLARQRAEDAAQARMLADAS